MRETKFRGKVLYNGNHYFSGEWVKGFYLENEKGESFIVDTEEDEFGNSRFQTVQIDPETVGQYTGRKDKTGKEIYAGEKLNHIKTGIVFEIIFDEEELCFLGITPKGIYRLRGRSFSECEIIGNIHEVKS